LTLPGAIFDLPHAGETGNKALQPNTGACDTTFSVPGSAIERFPMHVIGESDTLQQEQL